MGRNHFNDFSRPCVVLSLICFLKKWDIMGGRRKKPFISAINKKKRLLWFKKIKNKTLQYWKNVVFSGETKIKISGLDDCVFVWRTSTKEWLTMLHRCHCKDRSGIAYGVGLQGL